MYWESLPRKETSVLLMHFWHLSLLCPRTLYWSALGTLATGPIYIESRMSLYTYSSVVPDNFKPMLHVIKSSGSYSLKAGAGIVKLGEKKY